MGGEMIALDANEIALVSIGAVAAGFWAVVKAAGTEVGKRVATKTKQKLHHLLKVDSVCPGDEALKAVTRMASQIDEISAQFKITGNGSLKDAVIRISNSLQSLVVEVKHQTAAQDIAYDAAGLMIMRADVHGRVTWVSKSMRERFNAVYEGAFLGWSWLNHVHPEDRDRTRERWEQAVEDKCELQDEYRVILAGGLIGHVIDSSKPVWSDGVCVGWYCLLRVVSYTKPEPEALNASA